MEYYQKGRGKLLLLRGASQVAFMANWAIESMWLPQCLRQGSLSWFHALSELSLGRVLHEADLRQSVDDSVFGLVQDLQKAGRMSRLHDAQGHSGVVHDDEREHALLEPFRRDVAFWRSNETLVARLSGYRRSTCDPHKLANVLHLRGSGLP